MVGLTREQKTVLSYMKEKIRNLNVTYSDAIGLTSETIKYVSDCFRNDGVKNPRNAVSPTGKRIIEMVYAGLMSKGYWDEADKFRFAVKINFER